MVGIGDHRQTRDAADARGLLDEFAESDQGEVRRTEYLQGGDGATEDTDLEVEISGDAGGHGVEYRSRVVAAVGSQQGTKGTA